MKLVVVTGWVDPSDKKHSKRRPAVVLGMVNGRVIVAPCTTLVMRTGEVPRGGVLLTKASAAHAGTGLHADQVIVWVRNAASYSLDSDYVKSVRQIGFLDTELDKRFRDNLRDTMKRYDETFCNRLYD